VINGDRAKAVTKTTLFGDPQVKQNDSFVIEVTLTEKNYTIDEPFPSMQSFELAAQLVDAATGDVILWVRDRDGSIRGLYAQRWILIKYSEYFASRILSPLCQSTSFEGRTATMLEREETTDPTFAIGLPAPRFQINRNPLPHRRSGNPESHTCPVS
jgi:hypothetical protein